MTVPFDTVFSVPSPDGDHLLVSLVLDVPDPNLSPVERLLTPPMLDVLAGAALAAEQPYRCASEHVAHAVEHLKREEYVHAWPPLVIGVEGLYWAEAEQKGLLDDRGRFTAAAKRRVAVPEAPSTSSPFSE